MFKRFAPAIMLFVAGCAYVPKEQSPQGSWIIPSGLNEAAHCAVLGLDETARFNSEDNLDITHRMQVTNLGAAVDIVPQPQTALPPSETYSVHLEALSLSETKATLYATPAWAMALAPGLSACGARQPASS